MVSVNAIGSEVFGSRVGGINVTVELENRCVWLCFGWKHLTLKLLKIGGIGGLWCQVLEGALGNLGVIEEIKSPCRNRGFAW